MKIFISYKAMADWGLFLFKTLVAYAAGMLTTLFCLIMGVSDFRNGGFTVVAAVLAFGGMANLFNWLSEEKTKKIAKDTPKIQPVSDSSDATVFSLSAEDSAELAEWQEGIKKEFGEYGLYLYTFEPTGIGMVVKIHSQLADKTLDLSHVERW